MTLLAILIRPLIAFALFFMAALLGRWILRRLPTGRLKQFLNWRLTIYPQTEAERRDWWPVFWCFFAAALIFLEIWLFTGFR